MKDTPKKRGNKRWDNEFNWYPKKTSEGLLISKYKITGDTHFGTSSQFNSKCLLCGKPGCLCYVVNSPGAAGAIPSTKLINKINKG